jgi:hypothetical protein
MTASGAGFVMNTRAWSHESEHQGGVQSRPLAETQACQKGFPADFDLLRPELHTLFVHHHIEQLGDVGTQQEGSDPGVTEFLRVRVNDAARFGTLELGSAGLFSNSI